MDPEREVSRAAARDGVAFRAMPKDAARAAWIAEMGLYAVGLVGLGLAVALGWWWAGGWVILPWTIAFALGAARQRRRIGARARSD
jgi:hypothetical protein